MYAEHYAHRYFESNEQQKKFGEVENSETEDQYYSTDRFSDKEQKHFIDKSDDSRDSSLVKEDAKSKSKKDGSFECQTSYTVDTSDNNESSCGSMSFGSVNASKKETRSTLGYVSNPSLTVDKLDNNEKCIKSIPIDKIEKEDRSWVNISFEMNASCTINTSFQLAEDEDSFGEHSDSNYDADHSDSNYDADHSASSNCSASDIFREKVDDPSDFSGNFDSELLIEGENHVGSNLLNCDSHSHDCGMNVAFESQRQFECGCLTSSSILESKSPKVSAYLHELQSLRNSINEDIDEIDYLLMESKFEYRLELRSLSDISSGRDTYKCRSDAINMIESSFAIGVDPCANIEEFYEAMDDKEVESLKLSLASEIQFLDKKIKRTAVVKWADVLLFSSFS